MAEKKSWFKSLLGKQDAEPRDYGDAEQGDWAKDMFERYSFPSTA
ncbi:hypothetical protein [Clostridium vitabionis]|nr:hypothetical protein [Clostridium vitabionis]